jgi:hypothetical protein
MDNQLPFSRRLRKLVLAGTKVAAVALAWKLAFYEHSCNTLSVILIFPYVIFLPINLQEVQLHGKPRDGTN